MGDRSLMYTDTTVYDEVRTTAAATLLTVCGSEKLWAASQVVRRTRWLTPFDFHLCPALTEEDIETRTHEAKRIYFPRRTAAVRCQPNVRTHLSVKAPLEL